MGRDLSLVTVAEVARSLRISESAVRSMLHSGELPGYRIGSQWRIDRRQLRGWVQRQSNLRASSEPLAWFTPEGRISRIPVRFARRDATLRQVAQRFAPGVIYSERQVNRVLRQVFDDHVRLRRELLDARLLIRTGSRYRRASLLAVRSRRAA